MRTALFWVIVQLVVGPIGCPEILVRNYYYSLHNNP